MKNLSTPKKNILGLITLIALFCFSSNFYGQTSHRKSISISHNNSNGRHSIKTKANGQNFSIEYEGDITISDNDKDIVSISRGGFLIIKKSTFGSKRKIVIQAESKGLTKEYYVGRSKKSFNPEGKAWLAQILPDILRTTGIGAESRVARFHKKGGAQSVLNEIKKMSSDYVASTYLKLLLQYDLSPNELIRTIKTAGNQIESDYYLSEILISNQKHS